MALIKCKECGKEISSKSEVCINCGCPVDNEEEKVTPVIKVKNDNVKKMIFVFAIIALIIVVVLIANINKVKVPYLRGVTEENAISTLQYSGLIPFVEYSYDEYTEEGKVISTTPDAYTKVPKGDTINILVSKGPSKVWSESSTIQWYNIGIKEDEWSFINPYIEEGYLYIECSPTFGTSFNWKSGGFGNASITDTFNKMVPVDIIFDNEEVKAGKEQNFTIKVSTKDLDVKKPTSLYTRLVIEVNGKQEDIRVNFSISW